jgi:hypothetical protein
MKVKVNEKGQALVIVLFFSAIALLMVLAVLYMVLRGTAMSGVQKRYQTALDAGYAGVGVGTAFLDSGLYYTISSPSATPVFADPVSSAVTAVSGTLTIQPVVGTCFYSKIFTPFDRSTTPGTWTGCSTANPNPDASLDPTVNPDLQYTVNGVNSTYYVYTKIVDSRAGITAQRPPGGLEVARGFANPTGTQGLNIQSQAYFFYTVEVRSQETNATTGKTRETAQISFDYAY